MAAHSVRNGEIDGLGSLQEALDRYKASVDDMYASACGVLEHSAKSMDADKRASEIQQRQFEDLQRQLLDAQAQREEESLRASALEDRLILAECRGAYTTRERDAARRSSNVFQARVQSLEQKAAQLAQRAKDSSVRHYSADRRARRLAHAASAREKRMQREARRLEWTIDDGKEFGRTRTGKRARL